MAPVALLSVEVVYRRPIKSGVIFLRGGESLRHLSDGPFEPDPDSTGVGIGRNRTYGSIIIVHLVSFHLSHIRVSLTYVNEAQASEYKH